jgi:hypothetical protein
MVDLIERKAVADILEAMADESEAVRRADESDLDYRRRTALANAARTILNEVAAMSSTDKDAVRKAGFLEGMAWAAKRVRGYTHHCHWLPIVKYRWTEEVDAMGTKLPQMIANELDDLPGRSFEVHERYQEWVAKGRLADPLVEGGLANG